MFTSTLVLLCLVSLAAVSAWGPGTHLELAHRVYRRRRENLPARVADLAEARPDLRISNLHHNAAATACRA